MFLSLVARHIHGNDSALNTNLHDRHAGLRPSAPIALPEFDHMQLKSDASKGRVKQLTS